MNLDSRLRALEAAPPPVNQQDVKMKEWLATLTVDELNDLLLGNPAVSEEKKAEIRRERLWRAANPDPWKKQVGGIGHEPG